MPGRTISGIWVETELHVGNIIDHQVEVTEQQCHQKITVENTVGFPLDAKVGGNVTGGSTNICFDGHGSAWDNWIKMISQRKRKDVSARLDLSKSSTGHDNIVTRMLKYKDRLTNSVHSVSPAKYIDLPVEVTQ